MKRDWQNIQLCDRYLDALERRDYDAVEQCYAPECIIWHSDDWLYRQRADDLASLQEGRKNLKAIEYADRIARAFEGGFVVEYTIKVVRETGFEGKLECCFVAHTRDGKISRAYEYWCENRIDEFVGPAATV